MLRELLKIDFGIDLPISGGIGSPVTDPIVIESSDPQEASFIEMEILRCVCLRNGWHWRTLSKNAVEGNGPRIEKLTYESKVVEGDVVITDRRALYFEVSAVKFDDIQKTPPAVVNLGEAYGMRLPFELGWLHYHGLTEFEDEHPGMGISSAYGAPYTKATIYIYNKRLPVIDYVKTPDLFRSEFDSAIQDILSLHKDAKLYEKRQNENIIFLPMKIEEAYSALMLATFNNYFIKVRATLEDPSEAYRSECLMQSFNYLYSLLQPEPTNHS